MAARPSPRRQDPPARDADDPPATASTLSSIIPPPAEYSEDRVLTMLDEITSLLAAPGWRWLIAYATEHYGSKAVRARLHSAAANSTDVAILGAITQATLASASAVEQLLNAPTEALIRLKMEQRKHAESRKQATR